MIPLRDSRRRKRFAWATWTLAAACAAVFVIEIRAGSQLPALLDRTSLVPAHLVGALRAILHPWAPGGAFGGGVVGVVGTLGTVVSSMFLHGSLVHLIGNLLFLVVFGDDLEGELRGLRFLAFYLSAGIVAAAAQVAVAPASTTPLIGASGAIAGILGAFLVLFPKTKISGVLPLGCIVIPTRSRAFLFLPVWFLIQLLSGVHALGGAPRAGGGVAWFAHLGGFLAGPPLYLFWRKRRA